MSEQKDTHVVEERAAIASSDNNVGQSKDAQKLPLKAYLLIGAWTLMVSAISGWFVWNQVTTKMEEELALRPRVVVIDSFSWIKSAGTGDTTETKYENGARALNKAIKKLRAQNVLVLEKSTTVTAPQNVILNAPDASKLDDSND